MIVVLDRQAPLRARSADPHVRSESRSVMLGLAPTPSSSAVSAWPRWLISFESAHLTVARSSHRRSRRSA
jgi:hypothetical protein